MNFEEYAEFVVKSICKEPDLIRVQSFQEEDVVVLDIMVPESMMGAVIGKSGKVAGSIRTLIQAYAYLHQLGKVRVNIEAF
ncbi:MAG: KH domain-containing protein [Bacilli bacterium]|nr:KH domain-containing protein [Bacilli bacterium]